MKVAFLAPQLIEFHDGKTILEVYDLRWKTFAKSLNVEIRYLSQKDDLPLRKDSFLILPGGGDIYAMSRLEIDRRRDNFSLKLCDWAKKWKWSVLAVCRSAQLLNVANRGRIYPISRHVNKEHLVYLPQQKGSFLVNSYHRFGILPHQLAKKFVPIASDSDGRIEAFFEEKTKTLGLMWHPERPGNGSGAKKLVKDFFDGKI